MLHPKTDLRIFVAMTQPEFDRLFAPESAAALESLGEVTMGTGGPKVEVPADVGASHDVLVTSWATAPFPSASVVGPRLSLAAHAAGSVRGLFPRETLEGGLRLTQGGAAPMALAVAEMALTLSLALLRNLHQHDRELQRTRDWQAGGSGRLGRAIHARRVGIVGLGRSGAHYARMVRGLGAEHVVAFDPFATAERAAELGVELVGLDELFAGSDLVAIHAPSTPETHRMVGAHQLGLLPDGAVIVNTARSWSVDQAALLAELESGRLSAGLDVFDTEPLPADSPFFGRDNVLLTPHVAGGTVEARLGQGETVVAELRRHAEGEPLEHEVTLAAYDRLA
ncbi:hydroxyacid dehydrogenase [Georgenia subflava]|uniref:D-isomer specific 2-hydroxyacid dehydrogenase NAD-binding domain-containing protein n=1 Tax=Georgenia subflava TaxID=1622177 RepID=A0A6N7EH14_9MICO|nr:hydroxyacid dehydrogenase [Georgenia subflava]MPV36453.1 hypothetical protein [Georgenia subflava]